MVQEPVDAGFSPSREFLAEVDVLPDVRDRIVVCALDRRLGAEHVRQGCSVADFLVGHELEQVSIFGMQSGILEFVNGERGQSPAEKVKFDPFLIEGQRDGFVVEVAYYTIDRLRSVGSQASSRRIGCRLRLVELPVCRILRFVLLRRSGRDG